MRRTPWVEYKIGALTLLVSICVLSSCTLEPSYTFMAAGGGSAIAVECGWWLYADGPGTSGDPSNPSGGAAHHKVLLSDSYQGAEWWRCTISAADALAGGSVIYVQVTSPLGGGLTMIVDEQGNRVDTMHYYASGPESDAAIGPQGSGSAGGPGSIPSYTVICTELHRQGLMDEAIFKADEAFGERLRDSDGAVLVGYNFWAEPVVSLMQKSSAFTQMVNVVARPWSYEMAYRMGTRDKGSFVGRLLLSVGVPLCRGIGRAVMRNGNPWLQDAMRRQESR